MIRFYESKYFGLIFFFFLNACFFYPFFLRSEIPVDPNPLYRTFPWRAYQSSETIHEVDPVRYFHNIDSTLMIYPLREEVRRQILNRITPLWIDSLFCGAPLLANQVGAFDFLSLLLLPVPTFRAYGLQVILQLTLAGLFLFMFCELLGLRRSAALLAGIAFMWNGFFFRNLAVITVIGTLLWQPLLLYFVHRIYQTKSWRSFHGLTFALIAQFYGGYAQYWIYNLGITAAYAMYLFWISKAARPSQRHLVNRGPILTKTACAIVLAIVLSLPQIVPFYQALKDSPRTDPQTNIMYQGRNHLSPRKIITFAIPDFYGNTQLNAFSRLLLKPPVDVSKSIWDRMLFGETPSLYHRIWGYVGLITIVLALLVWRKKEARFWVIIGILPLFLLLLLNFSIVRSILRIVWEGLDRIDHTRSIVVSALSFSILGAIGLHHLLENSNLILRVGKVLTVIALCLLVIFSGFYLVLSKSSDSILQKGKTYYEANQNRLPWNENTQSFALEGIQAIPGMIRSSFQILIIPFALFALFALLTFLFGKDTIPTWLYVFAILSLSSLDLGYRGRYDPPLYFSKQEMLYPPPPTSLDTLKGQIDPHRVLEIQRKKRAPEPPLKSYFELGSYRTRGLNFFDFQAFDFVTRPDSLVTHRLPSAGGYLSLYPASIRELSDGRANDNLQFARPNEPINKWSGNWIDIQSIRYILADPGSKSTKYPTIYSKKDLTIFENEKALPRAYVVNQIRSISTYKETLDVIRKNGFDPKQTVLLQEGLYLKPANLPLQWKARIRKSDPSNVQIEVETNQESILVLTDTFNDGWEVTVDQEAAPMYRANYAFRGVRISAGSHVVDFRYFPWEFQLSLYLSAAGLVCWIVLFLLKRHQ